MAAKCLHFLNLGVSTAANSGCQMFLFIMFFKPSPHVFALIHFDVLLALFFRGFFIPSNFIF